MHLRTILLLCRYGYVTPDDVPAMLDQHIAKGEIIQNLSRFVFLFPACCRYVSVKSALHFLVYMV